MGIRTRHYPQKAAEIHDGRAVEKQLETFFTYLRDNGLKMTRPRRAVLERIFGSHQHFTAEELVEEFRKQGKPVSRATVYRILTLLKKSATVEEHDFQHGSHIFENVFGLHHHDHMYCVRCGKIIEFEVEEIEKLQEKVCRKARFTQISHSHKVFGFCESCRGKARGASPPPFPGAPPR